MSEATDELRERYDAIRESLRRIAAAGEEKLTVPGWYWFEGEYPEEGANGPFDTKDLALADAAQHSADPKEAGVFEFTAAQVDRDEQLRIVLAELAIERDDNAKLRATLNSPEVVHFAQGVMNEAAHQIDRWGEPHDRSKSAEGWFWLIAWLAGKALRAAITGDRDKALHHTISTAAVCANWHRAILRDETGAGIGSDADIRPQED